VACYSELPPRNFEHIEIKTNSEIEAAVSCFIFTKSIILILIRIVGKAKIY